MKKTIFASLAALTALTAAPAFAAPGDYDRGAQSYQNDDGLRGGDRYDRRDYGRGDNGFRDGRGSDVRGELGRLDMMIDRGIRNGSINWREARAMKSELRDIRDMQGHFWRTGGMDYRERAIIDRRVDRLRQAIWRESNDRGDRYHGGGWR